MSGTTCPKKTLLFSFTAVRTQNSSSFLFVCTKFMKLRSADMAEDASCVTVCTVKNCVLWDVMLCRWMSGSFLVDYVTLSMKALQSFETS